MKNKSWIWIGLGGVAVGIRWILGYFPQAVESFYTRGLFLAFRKALDVITVIPIPFVYIVLGGILVYLTLGIVRLVKSKDKFLHKIGRAFLSFGAFLGGTVFFFLLFWGYNYARLPLETHLKLSLAPLSKEDLETSLKEVIPLVKEQRIQFGKDSVAVVASHLPEALASLIRSDLQHTLKDLGYPYQFSPKVRQLQPKGILLRFNTLGVYFPWTGECNIDVGLHPLEKPFVMAHEMAHGYGFTDEGTCNFLAYLACIRSKNSFIQYAGYFEYFSTLAVNYRKYDREAYTAMMKSLPASVKADWNSIIENHEHYPNIMPKLRHYTYDTYLKVQGISEGIQNYNRVLMLVKAWEVKSN
jgi:hypothetical protein